MKLQSPSNNADPHLLQEKNLLWNGLFSPRKVDMSAVFQNLNKSPTEGLVDFDPQPNMQLLSINKEPFPKKTPSLPALNFYQTFSSTFNSPQLSFLLASPCDRKPTPPLQQNPATQTQSQFFMTAKSNPLSRRGTKPQTPKHNFTLQLGQIDRSSTVLNSPKLKSIVQTTSQTQESARLSSGLLTIRSLSRNETVASSKSHRVKLQGTSRLGARPKVTPLSVFKKEKEEAIVEEAKEVKEVKVKQLSEKKMNFGMYSERQKSALIKLSDILETDPKKLSEISKKFINSNIS